MEKAIPIVPPWIEAVKQQFGTPDAKWAAAGYCFGAPFVMDCIAFDWVSAGAYAHPAYLNEDHFRHVKKPLLLSCACSDSCFTTNVDFTFPTESRRKAIDILMEIKATYHLQVFSGVSHGFALRGDAKDLVAKWAKEKSADGILSWFNLFCA